MSSAICASGRKFIVKDFLPAPDVRVAGNVLPLLPTIQGILGNQGISGKEEKRRGISLFRIDSRCGWRGGR
jgi:hypothetical protein